MQRYDPYAQVLNMKLFATFKTLDLRPLVLAQQIVMELPVEHGLLLDNLLDLAHAPFTHTSTFAKGWSVPRLVFPGPKSRFHCSLSGLVIISKAALSLFATMPLPIIGTFGIDHAALKHQVSDTVKE